MRRSVFVDESESAINPLALPSSFVVADSPTTALSPALQHILREVQREIGFGRLEAPGGEFREDFEELVSRIAERFGFDLTNYERDLIVAQVEKEQRPFGVIQDLVDDPKVSDIIVSAYNAVTVQQGRRNYNTGVTFPNQENYEAFVEKLLSRAGSSYSTKKPIADGMIGSFARIHAVHGSISDGGPYCTIRLNRFSSVSLKDLENNGLAPNAILTYLKAIVKSGNTVLVAGEVGTGKTTLARALSSTMPHDESILVIEDTPEIRLEHPHVRYMRTREANNDGAGRVTPSECIRGGMRMAMNRIIFGEVRDAEAAEAFIDVCASGHPGLSTIHARSAIDTIARLELFLGRAQKGVSQAVLQQQIGTAVQVVVHIDICKATGRRRVMEVVELGAVADGVLRHRGIFRYTPRNGSASWNVESRISTYRDQIESLPDGIRLNTYPTRLELSAAHAFKDAAANEDYG